MAWITVRDAMDRTGWTRRWIIVLIEQKRLRARKLGPIWTISEASLENFMKLDRPTGRPPKRRSA